LRCAPLDILIVRKLGVPFQPELAMGAIGEDEVLVVDERVVADARITAPSSGRSSTPSARNWSCGFAVSVVGAHRCRWSGER